MSTRVLNCVHLLFKCSLRKSYTNFLEALKLVLEWIIRLSRAEKLMNSAINFSHPTQFLS